MTVYLEAVDPRGYKVVCSQEYWNDHVIGHHPNLKDREQEIIKAIEKPSIGIYADADFDDREVYYFLRPNQPRYMKVVVAFDQAKLGILISAFYADSPKAGEKLIWPE